MHRSNKTVYSRAQCLAQAFRIKKCVVSIECVHILNVRACVQVYCIKCGDPSSVFKRVFMRACVQVCCIKSALGQDGRDSGRRQSGRNEFGHDVENVLERDAEAEGTAFTSHGALTHTHTHTHIYALSLSLSLSLLMCNDVYI